MNPSDLFNNFMLSSTIPDDLKKLCSDFINRIVELQHENEQLKNKIFELQSWIHELESS